LVNPNSLYLHLEAIKSIDADVTFVCESKTTCSSQNSISGDIKDTHHAAWGAPMPPRRDSQWDADPGGVAGFGKGKWKIEVVPTSAYPQEMQAPAQQLYDEGRFIHIFVPYGDGRLGTHFLLHYGISGARISSSWQRAHNETHLQLLFEVAAV